MVALAACASSSATKSVSVISERSVGRDLAQAFSFETYEWYGSNKAILETMILENGIRSPHYSIDHKPVAVFDWDNTTVKNDVGDATFYWLVNHNGLRHPGDWQKSSPELTEAAVSDLNRLCPGKKGEKIRTEKMAECATLMVSIYDDGVTADGKTSAWRGLSPDTEDPACMWTVQLMEGYTPRQVHRFAKKAIRFNLKNPIGATQKVGGFIKPAFVRVYEHQKSLIRDLQQNGFEVWVATASDQDVVQEIAPEAGIDPNHVIGIRPVLDQRGRYTDAFEGCGPYADGTKEIISYRKGKRCWINKVIFGVKEAQAQMETPNASIFAAGDADTDVFFVRDAKYHLVINRNKHELMCNAYQNADQRWMINPMFIQPKAQNKAGYSCNEFGIPDQVDSVF